MSIIYKGNYYSRSLKTSEAQDDCSTRSSYQVRFAPYLNAFAF